ACAKCRDEPQCDIFRCSRLFDHLVGSGEEHRRNSEAKRLRRLEIDYQLEGGRLFDRESCWILTLENAIDEDCRSTEHRVDAGAVAQETACRRKLSPRRYYRHSRRPCPLGDA